jgi:hypothetical protein
MEFWTVFYNLYFLRCQCEGRGEWGNEAEVKRGYMQRPPAHSKEKAEDRQKRPRGKGMEAWSLFSWKSKRPLLPPSNRSVLASLFICIHSPSLMPPPCLPLFPFISVSLAGQSFCVFVSVPLLSPPHPLTLSPAFKLYCIASSIYIRVCFLENCLLKGTVPRDF